MTAVRVSGWSTKQQPFYRLLERMPQVGFFSDLVNQMLMRMMIQLKKQNLHGSAQRRRSQPAFIMIMIMKLVSAWTAWMKESVAEGMLWDVLDWWEENSACFP
jgi:hypothetical protein